MGEKRKKILAVIIVILTLGFSYAHGQTIREMEQIFQKAIDLDELQPFYHEKEIKARIPLIIINDSKIPNDLKLMKFGEPVKIISKSVAFQLGFNLDDIMELVSFEYGDDMAQIELNYRPEGIRVKVYLKKSRNDWRVKRSNIIEY